MVTSTNKGLSEPASGALNWNTDLNGNFEIIDKAMGAAVSISLTGLSTYATSAAQCQYMSMNFTGTPSDDVSVSIPTGVAGQWVIQNNTNKTITVSSLLGGASTAVVVAGSIRSVYCNGTNVYFADAQSGGADTQIAYTSGGTLVGSSDLTFNGATESIGASATITGWASGAGNFTATFNANKLVPVGSYVFLTGVTTTPSTPNGFNAAFTVTASTQVAGASTVTFAATGIGASPAGGTLAYGNLKIGGTNVTASAAELSKMAGITSTPYSSVNLATQAQAEAGTDNTTLMTPLRTSQLNAAQRYNSGEQTISSLGVITLAHGLGIAPAFIGMTLICKVADSGFSVGDKLAAYLNNSDPANTRINRMQIDNTNIVMTFSNKTNCFTTQSSTGSLLTLTNSSWKLIIDAMA